MIPRFAPTKGGSGRDPWSGPTPIRPPKIIAVRIVICLLLGLTASPSRSSAFAPAPSRAGRPASAPDSYQRSGDRFLRSDDLAGAAREYARAALAAPKDPFFRLTTGVALAALGDVERAARQFQQAQALAEDDIIAALLLQGALDAQGKTSAALTVKLDTVRRFSRKGQAGLDASGSINYLRGATARFPESPIAWLLLGDAYQVSEQWDAAEQAYSKASRLAPAWAKPRVNLGVLLLSRGQPDAAVKAFEAALAREPGNTQVQLLSADALAKSGRAVEALKTYRKLENAPGVAADVSTRIGNVYLQTRRPQEALAAFSRARTLAPRDAKAAAGEAEAQIQAGNFAAGAEAYRSALGLANAGGLLSTRPILYRGLAEAQLSARQPDAALQTLERALREEPQSTPLWYRLSAEAYFAKGDMANGETALRRALDSDVGRYPRDILDALAGRGLLERTTAAYEAEAAVAAVPSVLTALAHLARYRGQIEREVDLRKKVAAARPLGANWFLLADAYERAGRPIDARGAYARALDLGGLSPAAAEQTRAQLRTLTRRLQSPPQSGSPEKR